MPSAIYQPAPYYPAPAFVPAQNQFVPEATAPRAAAPAQPRPLVRAKAPDELTPPRPAPLAMPSPEQLGVAVRSTEPGLDWAAIHARIKELGIIGFHMDSAPDGSRRFTCWVPRGQPGVTQRIEALATTEAEAVRLALEQAGRSGPTHP